MQALDINKRGAVSIYCSADLKARIYKRAFSLNMSKTDYLRMVIEKSLDGTEFENKNKKPPPFVASRDKAFDIVNKKKQTGLKI